MIYVITQNNVQAIGEDRNSNIELQYPSYYGRPT